MALDGVKNFAIVTVSTGYDDDDTSIVLATGHGAKLPDPATANFNLVWWDSSNYTNPADDPKVEIVRCTAKSTDTLTVTRAQESTSGQTKNTAAAVYKMALTITAKMITDIASELSALVTKALFDANTILAANSDNTPAALEIAEQRIVGRKTGGNIIGLTGAEVGSIVGSASDTAAGIVEIATATEIDTGTNAGLALSPDTFAGSNRGKRVLHVKVFDDATALATGNGKAIVMIPVELNGMNLVDCEAFVTTVSSSGAPTVQIRNITDSQDMLSTEITIDANEKSSLTAATAPVINTSYDDVTTGDLIAIDVDGAGTGAKGLGVLLSFQTP